MVTLGGLALEGLLPAQLFSYQRHQNTLTNLETRKFFLLSQHGALRQQKKPGESSLLLQQEQNILLVNFNIKYTILALSVVQYLHCLDLTTFFSFAINAWYSLVVYF